jgi:hypothetical protein
MSNDDQVPGTCLQLHVLAGTEFVCLYVAAAEEQVPGT